MGRTRAGRATGWIAGVAMAGLLGFGCGHAHSVGPAESPAAADASHATPPVDAAARPPRAPAHAEAHAHAVPHEAPPSDPATREPVPQIPIATSPAGLLKPGAEKKIQDKLAGSGLLRDDHPSGELDGPTREALRRFQRQHDLPATGTPDDATVRKLGLSPVDVFKSGEPPK